MPALTTYTTQVQPAWVDYNGHLRDAFYLLIFSYATDALMDILGLDSDKLGATSTTPDVNQMPREEFDALPESTKARMRGDFV